MVAIHCLLVDSGADRWPPVEGIHSHESGRGHRSNRLGLRLWAKNGVACTVHWYTAVHAGEKG